MPLAASYEAPWQANKYMVQRCVIMYSLEKMPGAPLSFGCLLSSSSAPKQSPYLRHTKDLDIWVVCWITGFITRFALLLHITPCFFLPKMKLLEFFSRQYSTSEHTSTSVLIYDASQTKKFSKNNVWTLNSLLQISLWSSAVRFCFSSNPLLYSPMRNHILFG